MGWYVRKSFKAGPFRMNLSKSGVGFSTGVKGFRVGTGPKGKYLHMGTGGLYYRKSLESPTHYSSESNSGPALQSAVTVERKCHVCGNQLSEVAQFCNQCGENVVAPNSEALQLLPPVEATYSWGKIIAFAGLIVFVTLVFRACIAP